MLVGISSGGSTTKNHITDDKRVNKSLDVTRFVWKVDTMRLVAAAFTIFSLCVVVDSVLVFKYHTNKEIEEVLRNFTKTTKKNVRTTLYSIGKTRKGKYGFWIF